MRLCFVLALFLSASEAASIGADTTETTITLSDDDVLPDHMAKPSRKKPPTYARRSVCDEACEIPCSSIVEYYEKRPIKFVCAQPKDDLFITLKHSNFTVPVLVIFVLIVSLLICYWSMERDAVKTERGKMEAELIEVRAERDAMRKTTADNRNFENLNPSAGDNENTARNDGGEIDEENDSIEEQEISINLDNESLRPESYVPKNENYHGNFPT